MHYSLSHFGQQFLHQERVASFSPSGRRLDLKYSGPVQDLINARLVGLTERARLVERYPNLYWAREQRNRAISAVQGIIASGSGSTTVYGPYTQDELHELFKARAKPSPEVEASNRMLFGLTEKEDEMIIDIQAQIERHVSEELYKRKVEEGVQKMLRLIEQFGEDTHPEGTVLKFIKLFEGTDRAYTYLALKAGSRWHLSGTRTTNQTVSWEELVQFLVRGIPTPGYQKMITVEEADEEVDNAIAASYEKGVRAGYEKVYAKMILTDDQLDNLDNLADEVEDPKVANEDEDEEPDGVMLATLTPESFDIDTMGTVEAHQEGQTVEVSQEEADAHGLAFLQRVADEAVPAYDPKQLYTQKNEISDRRDPR